MLKKVVKTIAKIIKESIKLCFIIFLFFCLFLSMALRLGTDWAKVNYNYSSFDEILYTLGTSVTTASEEVLNDFFATNIYPPLYSVLVIFFIFIVFCIVYKIFFRNSSVILNIRILKKNFPIKFSFLTIIVLILTCVFGVMLHSSVVYAMDQLYINEYLETTAQSSTFFEEEYVNPQDVKLNFPEKKRNLIYIYLESMESTYTDKRHGGAYNINYIPELTDLAEDNVNFSSTNLVGGAHMPYGASWTMGGMVAQTSGVPIKTPFIVAHDENQEINYANGLVNGAYSLGEILEKEGYNQYIMVGSDLSFGGRRTYFTEHGNYQVYDYYTAIEDGLIDEDYYVWWGYEDEKLFDYAKDELVKIAEKDEPFNFTMLTVDTHAVEGYTSDFCKNRYDNHYLNSVACSSEQLGDFIDWIQDQDFYENTTIILAGDHLSMNNSAFVDVNDSDRHVFNVYINSAVEPSKEKNREFTTFDYYPTTLSSLGVKIQGNRLGLGTNLFSNRKTLSEEYGNDYIDLELQKSSSYYNSCITLNGCRN